MGLPQPLFDVGVEACIRVRRGGRRGRVHRREFGLQYGEDFRCIFQIDCRIPEATSAPILAAGMAASSFEAFFTNAIPMPPPPPAAFTRMGYPISSATRWPRQDRSRGHLTLEPLEHRPGSCSACNDLIAHGFDDVWGWSNELIPASAHPEQNWRSQTRAHTQDGSRRLCARALRQ